MSSLCVTLCPSNGCRCIIRPSQAPDDQGHAQLSLKPTHKIITSYYRALNESGQVVAVSLETAAIVAGLPELVIVTGDL